MLTIRSESVVDGSPALLIDMEKARALVTDFGIQQEVEHLRYKYEQLFLHRQF